MELGILYKRAKTGKIVSYRVWVDQKTTDDNPVIMKETGQLDGKKTIHTETIFKGKQKRSRQEQAEAQALSDWNKKRDEGYKSLKDLGSDITEDDWLIDNTGHDFKKMYQWIDNTLPEFNTTSTGLMKPMKAPSEPWKPGVKLKLQFPLLCEPKLDGNRAFLTINGPTDEVAFTSSSGKPIKTLDHLISIVKQSELMKYPGIYDGEVYCHGMTLNQINSAIKKVRESTLKLNFHIFDMPMIIGLQSIRSDYAKQAATRINHSKFPIVDSVIVQNEQEIMAHHDRWIEEGYEGAMLKEPNGTYQPGQRSSYWVKVKMFDDAEFKVIGYELGQRGVQDLTFVCECEKGTFNATMNGSIADKQELFNKVDTLIGKMLTVKYFGFTDYGIPNLPKGKAFRED